MSEQEQERPLTRRELRLREQAAQESAAQEAESGHEFEIPPAETPSPVEHEANVEIEISPFNEDGSVRTRREIRALREAAYAELREERASAEEAVAEEAVAEVEEESTTDVETDVESEQDPANFYVVNEAGVGIEDKWTGDVDISFGPPTEAFSIEDLLDAVQPVTPTGDADAVAALFADEDNAAETDAEAEAEVEAEVEAVEDDVDGDLSHDTAMEDADGEQGEDVAGADEVGNGEGSDAEVTEVAEERLAEDFSIADAADEQGSVEAEASEEFESEETVHSEADGDDDDWASSGEEPEDQPIGYSFPDIQPPEEWRSVFDDPSRISSLKNSGGTGDFDDLISRAVAQEGSTGATGVSALILPSHPGDTGGLAGPLGATGELFVTGSIELPKSLGETGGHAALLDSVESDQFLTGQPTSAMDAVQDEGPMPVSALSAVSARRRPEVPVVAEPTKDKSKMPIILALSGGGLLIIIAGAVILAATQGWFA